MRVSLRIAPVGLAFLLCTVTARAGVPAPVLKPPPAAALLPERTLALLVAEDVAATAERFRETNAYKLWREKEVQDFLRPLTEGFAKSYKKSEKLGGFSFADVLNAFRGHAVLAAVDVRVGQEGPPLPEVAFLAEVTDLAAAERVVARLAAAIGEVTGAESQIWRFGPVTIGRVFHEGEQLEVAYVLTPRALCVTFGPGGEVLSEIARGAWGRPGGATLVQDEALKLALQKAGGRRDLFAYIAYERAWKKLCGFVEAMGEQENADLLRRLHAALGLDGVRGVSFAEAVDAPGFRSQVYLHAPAPRKGAFEIISDEPVRRELLELAPAGASSLLALRLRPEKLLPLAREVAAILGAGAVQRVDNLLAAAGVAVGMDVEQEVINALGGEAVIFNAPVEAAGVGPVAGMAGLTLVARAAEPDVFGPAYDKLVEIVTGLAIVRGTDILEETTPEGAVVMYVQAGQGSTPAATWFDGHLVAGVTKQAVARVCASLRRRDEDRAEGSFASSADYEKALARAGAVRRAHDARVLSLPKGAGAGGGFLLGYLGPFTAEDIAPLLNAAPMVKGRLMRRAARARLPKEIQDIIRATDLAETPSAGTLAGYSVPQMSVGWRDEDGVGLTSWTTSGVITPVTVTAAVGAALAGPYVEQASVRAERRKCAANLRRICTALRGYAAAHGDGFPARLEDLVPEYLPDAAVLACPTSGKKYAYVSGLRRTDRPNLTVVYELPEGHQGGMNVLGIGGRVRWRRDIRTVERQVEGQLRRLRAEGRKVQVIGGMGVAPPAVEETGEEFF